MPGETETLYTKEFNGNEGDWSSLISIVSQITRLSWDIMHDGMNAR